MNVMEALASNNITAAEHEITVLRIGRLRDQVMSRAALFVGQSLTAPKGEPILPTGEPASKNNF